MATRRRAVHLASALIAAMLASGMLAGCSPAAPPEAPAPSEPAAASETPDSTPAPADDTCDPTADLEACLIAVLPDVAHPPSLGRTAQQSWTWIEPVRREYPEGATYTGWRAHLRIGTIIVTVGAVAHETRDSHPQLEAFIDEHIPGLLERVAELDAALAAQSG